MEFWKHISWNRRKIIGYLLLFAICLGAVWINYDFFSSQEHWSRSAVFLIILVAFSFLVIIMPNHCMEDFCNLTVFAGIFMRIRYTVITPYTERVHDLGKVVRSGRGHAAYILKLFETGSLPDNNQYQMYQPPFFHWCSAKLMQFFSIFHPSDRPVTMMQITKVVSCFAACVSLIVINQICDRCSLSKRAKLIVLILLSFFPNFYLMAGRVNNDSLAFMFMACIILYAIRWYQERTFGNIIALALFFGFGMMTKINVGILAFPVACMFAWKLLKEKEKRGNLFSQFVVFGFISLPLGLWYAVRNFVLFGQSPGYVMDPGKQADVYIGMVSLFRRFLPVHWNGFFTQIFLDVKKDFNIPVYIIKSSIFGEFTFENVDTPAKILLFANIFLILASMGAFIWLFLKRKKQKTKIVVSLWFLWGLSFASYLWFNYSYPYACTMDFRYIPLTACTGSFAIGLLFDALWSEEHILKKVLGGCVAFGTAVFAVASVYMYCAV